MPGFERRAVAQRVTDSTASALTIADFSINAFEYSNESFPEYDFVVTTEAKYRTNGMTVTVDYGVKLLDAKTCEVSAHMIAD